MACAQSILVRIGSVSKRNPLRTPETLSTVEVLSLSAFTCFDLAKDRWPPPTSIHRLQGQRNNTSSTLQYSIPDILIDLKDILTSLGAVSDQQTRSARVS
jgi:hypothetical protein